MPLVWNVGRCCAIAALAVAAVDAARAEEADTRVGTRIGNVALADYRGRMHSLEDFASKKLVVVAFLGTECPLAKLYGPRLAELAGEFAERDVAFVGVASNVQDRLTEVAAYARRSNIAFPILLDSRQQAADAFRAERTPEVFVLDADRVVRYRGPVDDQYGIGIVRAEPQRRHLAIALEELLAGEPVTVAEREPVGCIIGRRPQTAPHGDVTWSDQIVRIVHRRCVECHRDGEIAPFSLVSYADTLGWEQTIREVITDGRMPPWNANPKFGHFRSDARLTEEEKNLILTWIENGCPEGNPDDLPPPPQFADGWRIPEPDREIHMRDEPFRVPAEGVVDYQYFEVDPGFDEDMYVSGVEARPGNPSVVHHIIAYLQPPDAKRKKELRHMLVGYAPGALPVRLNEGLAIRIPAGWKLLFELHYTPNGYEQQDRSYIGLKFVDKEQVRQLIDGHAILNSKFTIPPGADGHEVTAEWTADRDFRLLDMTPHMHLRGKSFRYEAFYPDGTREILLDVPRYDFNWQLSYELAEPKLIPKGTRLLCTARYDNSEENPNNPDPTRAVGWGEQSWDEMMIGFLTGIPAKPSESVAEEQN